MLWLHLEQRLVVVIVLEVPHGLALLDVLGRLGWQLAERGSLLEESQLRSLTHFKLYIL